MTNGKGSHLWQQHQIPALALALALAQTIGYR
jgi:hypothetical protein